MLDQRGLERRNGKPQGDAEQAKRDHTQREALRHDAPAQQRRGRCGEHGRYGGSPQRRFALGGKVKNDAGPIGDREPWHQTAGRQFRRRPFANARPRTELRAPPLAAPARALSAARPGQRARLWPRSRARNRPTDRTRARPVLHLVLCHGAKAPGAPKDGAEASHPASSDATGSCGESELATAWIDQPPVVALASTLAQLSRSPTVRLKMSRPGTDSKSRQK